MSRGCADAKPGPHDVATATLHSEVTHVPLSHTLERHGGPPTPCLHTGTEGSGHPPSRRTSRRRGAGRGWHQVPVEPAHQGTEVVRRVVRAGEVRSVAGPVDP